MRRREAEEAAEAAAAAVAAAEVESSSFVTSPESAPPSEPSSELAEERTEARVSSFCSACTRRLEAAAVVAATEEDVVVEEGEVRLETELSTASEPAEAAPDDVVVFGAGVPVLAAEAAASALFAFFCFSISSSETWRVGRGGVTGMTGVGADEGSELAGALPLSFASCSFCFALTPFWWTRSMTKGESTSLMMPLRGARRAAISSVSKSFVRADDPPPPPPFPPPASS